MIGCGVAALGRLLFARAHAQIFAVALGLGSGGSVAVAPIVARAGRIEKVEGHFPQAGVVAATGLVWAPKRVASRRL